VASTAVRWGAWAGIAYVLALLIGLFLAPSAPDPFGPAQCLLLRAPDISLPLLLLWAAAVSISMLWRRPVARKAVTTEPYGATRFCGEGSPCTATTSTTDRPISFELAKDSVLAVTSGAPQLDGGED
jgi:hypothetical protein